LSAYKAKNQVLPLAQYISTITNSLKKKSRRIFGINNDEKSSEPLNMDCSIQTAVAYG
jgi:hypothetical protein